jgi:hypothetical protein
MLALNGFASVDDFLKLFNDPSPSPPQGTPGAGGGGGTVPQPGMHPLVNAFKSSRSFTNLRAASVADFPRTDSYAFLEVFFNEDGLDLSGDNMEPIGLSMDGDGGAEGLGTPTPEPPSAPASSGAGQPQGGLKRQAEHMGPAAEGAGAGPSKRAATEPAAAGGVHQVRRGPGAARDVRGQRGHARRRVGRG